MKARKVSEYLNDIYSTLYNHKESLAMNKVTGGRVEFQQYIPKEQRRLGIKLFKFCNGKRYIYDMTIYLGQQCVNVTSTHKTVHQLIRNVECHTQIVH
jgi:hypothetical protein